MRSRFGQRKLASGGLMTRLARDTRGGVYIMFALAFFPLLAMIGSGIDMSRAYMAHNRLQMACDAAALAGRRAMTNGTVDQTVINEANKFFQFNYKTGTAGVAGSAAFSTTGFTPSVTGAANATVVVSANTVVPTSIMRLFGFVNIPIQVTCNARLDFVNTDIVLVLDSTGSMMCLPTEDTCSGVTTERTGSKIVALRAAVLSMYDTLRPIQTQLEGVNLRLRYAVVPYSSSVNIGRVLRGMDPSYVVNDNWTYQSRIGNYRHISSGLSSSACSTRGGSLLFGYCIWTDNSPNGGNYSNSFQGWTYAPQTWDVSSYATGSSTPTTSVAGTSTVIPTRTDGSTTTWAGCIEERQTTQMSSTAASIPSGAWDLDIDMIPTTDKATKWKPYWPEVEYVNDSDVSYQNETYKPQWACPAEARRLQAWASRDVLSTYLNTLVATGGTYHDNGLRWAIRLLSGSGVFSADNPSTYGNMPVSKYIIFMTDGLMDTGYDRLYTTYGIEKYDARVTPGGSSSSKADQQSRHLNRFNLLCTLAKSRGISIWVVAFAQDLDDNLTACASNANQASTSANAAQLNARFVEIGKNIGALRLTQ